MKFLITLFSVFTLNIALADMGTLESHFTPPSENDHKNIIHLYLQNRCNQEIFVAIRSEAPFRVWETLGYMRIYPGQTIKATDMINNFYYLNAFTADRHTRWEGPHTFEIYGKNVRAALVELPNEYAGNWTSVLYCF